MHTAPPSAVAADAVPGYRPWIRLLAGFAIVLGAACATYTNWDMLAGQGEPSLEGVDDTGYYLWLRSGVIDGDFDFANDLAQAPTLRPEMREWWLGLPRTAIGRVPDKFPPGWAVATLPAFLVGHGAALLLGLPADGWSPPYFVAIWIYHLGLLVLGLWCATRVIARLVTRDAANLAVLALWIASPLIYYHTGRVGMVHGLLFTLVAVIHDLALGMREKPAGVGRWLLLGTVGALLGLVRASAVVYLLFPGLVVLATWKALPARERWGRAMALVAPGVLALALGGAANWTLHGAVWATPYPGEPFHFAAPQLAAVLFSPLHGWFYWHPLLLVGGAGLLTAAWRGALPRSWVVSLLLIIYINASWHSWWFGSSFGNRAFEGSVLYLMAGLAWLFARVAGVVVWRRRLLAATFVGVLAGAGLLFLFVTQRIPREKPVTYFDMMDAVLGLQDARRGVESGPAP